MTSAPNDTRTAHGFQRLRDRYVRRAEFLVLYEPYQDAIGEARTVWNTAYPRYLTGTPSDTPGDAPRALERDYRDQIAPMKRAPHDDSSDNGKLPITSAWKANEATIAMFEWSQLLTFLACAFWPEPNFPNSIFPNGHPARRAVAMSLHKGPKRLSGECVDWFDTFGLAMQVHYTGPDEPIPDFDTYIRNIAPYIPLYPGITANDLTKAIPGIVSQANTLMGDRTPFARIRSLRNAGLKQRKIADELGLTESDVQKALAKLRR